MKKAPVKENRLKKMIAEGKTAAGLWVASDDTDFVEIIGELGFDYIIIDQEHTWFGDEAVKNLILAADASSLVSLVRVASKNEMDIRKVLDMGAQGVIVPRVNTAEEARQVVQAAKFCPEGGRGWCPSVRGARWGMYGFGYGYTSTANRETMVILLIEEPTAYDNLESILAVEGVDAVYVGSGDLSVLMGPPLTGKMHDPAVVKKVEWAIGKAREKGMAVQLLCNEIQDSKYAMSKGAQLLAITGDLVMFYRSCYQLKQELQGMGLLKDK